MNKLDEIFNDLSISVYKAEIDTIDSLMEDGKKRTKELFLGYLYALQSMFEDPSMNAKTPPERTQGVIDKVKDL